MRAALVDLAGFKRTDHQHDQAPTKMAESVECLKVVSIKLWAFGPFPPRVSSVWLIFGELWGWALGSPGLLDSLGPSAQGSKASLAW